MPGADSGHSTQAQGTPAPLSGGGHELDHAWMWKALHLQGWSPLGYSAIEKKIKGRKKISKGRIGQSRTSFTQSENTISDYAIKL